MNAPAVGLLLVWSLIPLVMTLWFSFRRYNLMEPTRTGFDGLGNYRYLLSDPGLGLAVWNTVVLLGAVLGITIGLGTLLAVLFDQEFWGRGVARVLVLAPFFVMPTVSALLWKNMMMHPDNGFFAFLMRSVGLKPIDWFARAPLTSIVIIVSWQWLPFAVLTLIDGGAVTRCGAEGGGADGWRGTGCDVSLHYLAAPGAGDRGDHDDRDDFSAGHLRGDLCDDLGWAGVRVDEPFVPNLSLRADGV